MISSHEVYEEGEDMGAEFLLVEFQKNVRYHRGVFGSNYFEP
jgi:hypothetical protein